MHGVPVTATIIKLYDESVQRESLIILPVSAVSLRQDLDRWFERCL